METCVSTHYSTNKTSEVCSIDIFKKSETYGPIIIKREFESNPTTSQLAKLVIHHILLRNTKLYYSNQMLVLESYCNETFQIILLNNKVK